MITAAQAKQLSDKNIKQRHNDITKTETIMRNIEERAKKGLYYYTYGCRVSYAIAKTLEECGYKLCGYVRGDKEHLIRQLKAEQFKDDNFYAYRITISWGMENEV